MTGNHKNVVNLRDDGAQSALEARLRELVAEYGSPLFVIDEQRLRRQYQALQSALPGVELFYAVKALPDQEVVKALVNEGAGLDLASSGELQLARIAGVSPRQTLHSHPIKKDSEIRAALRFGTTTFVIDNMAELEKFHGYRNRVGLLIRLRYQSPNAVVDLSGKFGCDHQYALELLQRARQLDIRVKGFSFHVGSQSALPDAHVKAIHATSQLLRQARHLGAHDLNVLDIGGGFPVSYAAAALDIDTFCKPIREALRQLPARIRVLAEPGRYLVAPAASAVASVVGKAVRDGRRWYYLDDGVYGSWSGQIFDHANYPIQVFRAGEKQESVLAGPTCDSIDVISSGIQLPPLEIGDLVMGRQMGAYTAATATEFNSLAKARTVIINTRPNIESSLVDYV